MALLALNSRLFGRSLPLLGACRHSTLSLELTIGLSVVGRPICYVKLQFFFVASQVVPSFSERPLGRSVRELWSLRCCLSALSPFATLLLLLDLLLKG